MKIGSTPPTAIPQLHMDRIDPQLVDAAKGLEANFIKHMMRTMRASVDESQDELNNQGVQIFRGMLDDHYADETAKNHGIGIAEMVVRYLTQQQSMPMPVHAAENFVDGSGSLKNDEESGKKGI